MRLNMRHALLVAGSSFVSVGVVMSAAPEAFGDELATRQVYLVRQDFSDCTDSNVPNVDTPAVGGTVWVVRQSDGKTAVKVALTASPNTAYHFNLKCVALLGHIETNDEGVGTATFTFLTSSAGNVYAFDSYPEGAPAGNKFQSAQVKF